MEKWLRGVAEDFRRVGYEVEDPVQGGREEQPDLIARGFNETIAIEAPLHPQQPVLLPIMWD